MNRQSSVSPGTVPSVSELTEQIRGLLEPNFTDIRVEGELSNLYRSRNGHLYMTVKDSHAQLPCVIWNRTLERLGLDLEDGQQVTLGGSIQIYPPHGKYQLIVKSVELAGMGKLQQAFERLKEKLRSEGLFEQERKRPLPAFPLRIGVITSAAGAAFHDIVSTLEQRWPLATVYLYHSSVQGTRATAELVNGIRHFSSTGTVDLLIIGRGGGSLEDLWPFNEEAVARALIACTVPVISAVGHEVDFSISDFVADARAATPTQAALMATPDANELRFQTDDRTERMSSILRDRLQQFRLRVRQLSSSHALQAVRETFRNRKNYLRHLQDRITASLARRLPEQREMVLRLHGRLTGRMDRLIPVRRKSLTELRHRIDLANPDKPLEQGFVRVWQHNRWIQNSNKFQKEQPLELEWREGRIQLNS